MTDDKFYPLLDWMECGGDPQICREVVELLEEADSMLGVGSSASELQWCARLDALLERLRGEQ